MSRIIQLQTEEVLNEIIEGNAVYMMTRLREDTCLEEIIDAEAFVKLEETDERVERVSEKTDRCNKNEGPDEPVRDEHSEMEWQDNGAAADEGNARKAEREPEEILVADALPPDEPEKYPAKKKKKAAGKNKPVDHGKIVACYRAGRSIKWIADEIGCSEQTVYNHLEKEGLYKKKK